MEGQEGGGKGREESGKIPRAGMGGRIIRCAEGSKGGLKEGQEGERHGLRKE